jgi:Flp pilus assembly pilin Flp
LALHEPRPKSTGGTTEREEGQTIAEYGVALAVITFAVVASISLLSSRVLNAITSVADVPPG